MRVAIFALSFLLAAGASVQAAPAPAKPAPVNPEVDVCMRAAAAADHIKLDDVDKDGCVCATKELHRSLTPDDFALHEKMLEVIASGADEKSFNKQMSDVMLKRGMNQPMVDAFLVRSKKAQDKAQAKCNTAPPLLGPAPLLTPQPH